MKGKGRCVERGRNNENERKKRRRRMKEREMVRKGKETGKESKWRGYEERGRRKKEVDE